jgi:hypothetical protein
MEKIDQEWEDFSKEFDKTSRFHNNKNEVRNESNEINTKSLLDYYCSDSNEIENQLSESVNALLLEYNNNMESKLKYENFDFEYGLSEIHREIKYKIIKKFEKVIKDIPSQHLVQKLSPKHNLHLIETIDQSVEEYEVKIKQNLTETLNEYQNVLIKSIEFYDFEMKNLIKAKARDELNTEDLDLIHRESSEKVIELFRKESVDSYNGNIERYFLDKLNEEMIKMKNKFENLFSYLSHFDNEWKQMLKKENYISIIKVKKFCANEKQEIIKSVKKLEDSELTEIALLSLEKNFILFEKHNEENEKHERLIATNAIDLAFDLYQECFESKIKSGLFLQNDINDFQNKLLDYTSDALKKSCDFNEDQNYLTESCEEGFKMKVEESYDQLIARYQENFDKITNLLTKAKTEALKKYCSEMSSRLSVKAYFKNNEFNDIHYKSSRIGFEIFDSMTEFVRKEFDTESANKIVLESHSEIRRKITAKKDYFKSLIDKNAPKTSTIAIYFGHQYISAATYDNKVEVVLDKSGRKLRPNSISIGDEILYGFEAKEYYERTYLPNNFDIKQLLGRERKSFTNQELSSFPLKFSDNKLSVEVNYNEIKFDLSIESLLALMIDNIKTDAEKQFSKLMANIVITVPTNYTVIQRNHIRNVVKIAGFDNIDIISELSAAAIGYVTEKSKTTISNSRNVLFVVINRYDCDIAICNITFNKIQFKAQFYKNLNPVESNSIFGQIIGNTLSSYWSGNSPKNKTKKCFEELIVKTLRIENFEQKDIDEYVIAGDSQLIADLKEWMFEYFYSNLFNSDPIDIITSGAAIYSAMLSEKIKMVEISETSLYPIHYQLQRNKKLNRKVEVLDKNKLLPQTKDFNYYLSKRSDLPLEISIFQEETLVKTYLIESLPQPNDKWSHFFVRDRCRRIR